jgi:protein tyrosine phosphatase
MSRYIATQGPLSSMRVYFWYIVWEQESPLTTVVEHVRVKYHQYLSVHDSNLFYGDLSATCTFEVSRG